MKTFEKDDMSETLKECQHCGNADPVMQQREFGPGMILTCQNTSCLARIWGHDKEDVVKRWNRRAPGPATKAMVTWAREYMAFYTSDAATWPTKTREVLQAFIDENEDMPT